MQSVLSMFGNIVNGNNGTSSLLSNPIVSNIISSFTINLNNNLGIANDQAGGIAQNLVPDEISSLISKTTNPAEHSFDINGFISYFTNKGNPVKKSGGFNLQGVINKFSNTGLDTDGEGKIEMSDIISKVTGGTQQKQAGEGGILNIIKAFIK